MSRGCCLTAVSMLSDILNTLDYAFYFVACSIGHNIDEYAHLKTINTQVAEQSNSGFYKLCSMLLQQSKFSPSLAAVSCLQEQPITN